MFDYQGKKFQKYLINKGLSIVRVAEKLEVSRNTIYQYFKSEILQRETVNNIITKLNTTESEIWGDNTPAPKNDLEPDASKEQSTSELSAKIESLERLLAAKDETIALLKKMLDK